jgi:hypothetical protein
VTKRTPFSLVHSYKREGFVSNPLTAEIRKINDQLGYSDEEQQTVAELLEQNRAKMQKQFYKTRRKAPVLKKEDLVLVRAETPATGESRKLYPKFKGPYEVVKPVGNDRHLIQHIQGEMQSNRLFKGIISIDRKIKKN